MYFVHIILSEALKVKVCTNSMHVLYIIVFVEKYNEVQCDIVFGGTFYAYADISQFGLNFGTASVKDIIAVSMTITKAVSSLVKPYHPELTEASYISGTILYENSLMENTPVKFMLVYGDRHVSFIAVIPTILV